MKRKVLLIIDILVDEKLPVRWGCYSHPQVDGFYLEIDPLLRSHFIMSPLSDQPRSLFP